ncbi:MAG: membrane protein insertion efficiency factor YidD [Elusimicrobia bacterium RIFCSPLOWO2_01_FULL_59_12]|nr:MAG: membrane protein insertion efficiency factor YidD [Elusimicrobia bacterium RIFCSPLOWO2_01_FULL_59_12]
MIVRLLRGLIRAYQWQSPVWGTRCRFYPSCSEYMREALEVSGAWKGLWQGSIRILKCHPWHPGGYDPIAVIPAKARTPHCRRARPVVWRAGIQNMAETGSPLTTAGMTTGAYHGK